jgi:predicted nucleic acid-binding protein
MESMPVCVLSELTSFELSNALEGCRFRREISQEDVDRVLDAFDRDVASGVFTIHSFPPEIFARATALSRDHTSRLGTRGLDILHIAAAILLGASVFYTFDQRQARLARAAGLSVRPRSRR